ncbi:Protein FixA [[Clostridium] ultunense Esp]|uniref:electron transfer flavoprotein subunit beta/FixA family protein n=1 Tax=Thermicanus aegyptius TaxID=94009 RepID=UPI0002B6F125|nr:electron transfer flavoprotein subunit beta/FixA family protein [Thermicanus aegyptius]MBE3553779.1 electron transfer flavoprotein subunit beta/FixA family protein [Thermicanus sp.]CCQ92451.1 Protein FixA [[Clostridium] ultunense Esp]
MHILVCVKQVPDTKNAKLDPVTHTLDRRSTTAITNPDDTHAVEEAVRLKKRYGGTVSVLTMGPPQAVATMRHCVQLGADRGFMISDRAFAGADTLATSYALSQAIEKIAREYEPIDLVITGKMTIDGDTGQVGPGIARRLDIPPLTGILKVEEIDVEKKKIRVHRKIEGGYEILESTLPALITVDKSINKVSRASLPNMIRAARYQPVIWSVNDLEGIDRNQLGLKGSPTVVGRIFPPPKPTGGKKLEGPVENQVKELTEILLQRPEWIKKRA